MQDGTRMSFTCFPETGYDAEVSKVQPETLP
jgi:hypothetical protein